MRTRVAPESGSGVSSVTVSGTAISGYPTTFTGSVVVPAPVTGVLQDTVGARARVGLTFYNTNTGGFVQDGISGTSQTSVINHINTTRPTTNTPLAETLWTVTGYFAQQASMLSGPGPRYTSGDFTIGNGAGQDPLNYGTSTVPRWPICAKSFVLYITDGEPCSDGNLPTSLADYASGRSAFNCNGGSCPSVAKPNGGSFPASTFPSCSCRRVHRRDRGRRPLHAHDRPAEFDTRRASNISGTQNLTLYTIFAFGKGSTLLRYAAINGGFTDNGSHVPSPQSTWDSNNDGDPDNFYEAFDGAELGECRAGRILRDSQARLLGDGGLGPRLGGGERRRTSSRRCSTRAAPSETTSSGGRGRSRTCGTTWTPSSRTRPSARRPLPTRKLNLTNDYIAQFYFDNVTQLTKVKRWVDSNGDGVADSTASTVSFENLGNLWEAGKSAVAAEPRNHAANDLHDAERLVLTNFTIANASTIQPVYVPRRGRQRDDHH